jgi:hypothetical protein
MAFVGELIFDSTSDLKSIRVQNQSISQVWAASVCLQRCVIRENERTSRTIAALKLAPSSNLREGDDIRGFHSMLCHPIRNFTDASFLASFLPEFISRRAVECPCDLSAITTAFGSSGTVLGERPRIDLQYVGRKSLPQHSR